MDDKENNIVNLKVNSDKQTQKPRQEYPHQTNPAFKSLFKFVHKKLESSNKLFKFNPKDLF